MLSTEQLNWFLNRLKRKVDKLSFALGTMESRFLPGKVVDSIPTNPVPDNIYFDKGSGRIAMPDEAGGFVDFGGSMDGYTHVQVIDLPATLAPNTVYFVANGGKVVVTDAAGNPTEYGADAPIDYDKLDNDLRQTIILPNAANIEIDFDSSVAFAVEIQQDTTFTFSNVRENKQIKLILKGDHAITLTGVDTSDVSYDGARWNVIIIEATWIDGQIEMKAVSWV